VLRGWAQQARAVLPVESVFPANITRAQQEEQATAQMVSSQEAATAAALTELGYDIPVTLSVAAAVPGSGAEGVVEETDVLVALNGEPITTHLNLIEDLGRVNPGDDVVLGVLRDGEPMDLTITTTVAPTAEGGERAALGVFVASEFDFPFEVNIQIENIGGPSAGLMFALAIVDRLTPEDELNGVTVAGTGTMETDGAVGAIGGIEQKMRGALRDGASWFLAPADNCAQVVGAIPDGLRVVKVATLHEARSAIEAIGAGTAESLPTCAA
jgi:PDZ domain-containing protein